MGRCIEVFTVALMEILLSKKKKKKAEDEEIVLHNDLYPELHGLISFKEITSKAKIETEGWDL